MNNTTVTRNLIWRFMERFGAQIVSFVVTIVLARLLDPDLYGTVALATVFIAFLQVFVDSGLGIALIQKKEADEVDFSSVFFFNLGMCAVLFIGLFFAAPYIAGFFAQPELTAIIRVMSLSLIISGVQNVQQAYVSRNMLFKRFFQATLVGTVSSAIIGIAMAYAGCGVWSLIAQKLSNVTINTLVLWIVVKWRPRLAFSFRRLKGLLSYGWKLLVSSLIDTVFRDIQQLIIGKLYTTEDLAYYNKGDQFPSLVIANVNTSIDSVLLPTMSQVQDDKTRIKTMVRRAIKTSTYIMAPLMMGMAFTSDSIISLLLTDKWLPCVPFLCVFCITYMFYPIHTANLNAIKALGRSDLFLKLEIWKKVVGLVLLLATMWFGPYAICLSGLLMSVISQIVNSFPNRKLLNYSIFEQWKDIAPGICLAVGMGVAVWGIGKLWAIPVILKLLIQVIIGALIYIGGSVLFKIDSFYYVLNTAKQLLKKRADKNEE